MDGYVVLIILLAKLIMATIQLQAIPSSASPTAPEKNLVKRQLYVTE